jgi:hypothetical protein
MPVAIKPKLARSDLHRRARAVIVAEKRASRNTNTILFQDGKMDNSAGEKPNGRQLSE